MARLVSLPRPEGGAEREVIWTTRHNCSQGKALRGELGESIDEIVFGVGVMGWEMPLATPFVVMASDDCRACGVRLQMWFEWAGGRIWTPS